MQAWSNLLKAEMYKRDINQLELSLVIKKPASTVSHWLSGSRVPPVAEMVEIIKLLNIKQLTITATGKLKTEATSPREERGYTVEVLNISASAGTGVLIDTESIDAVRSIEYSNEKAHQIFGNLPANNIKILTVKGDSMAETLEAGDLVFVDISKSYYDGDGIYVFVYGETLFVKRLQRIKDRLRIISDNKYYEPWEIFDNEMDQLFIQGKVLLSQTHKLNRFG
jgi:phage repressor protein C with HTH and peptisase S24 domain